MRSCCWAVCWPGNLASAISLALPEGFPKGQVSVDVRAGAFTVCVQRHIHVHRCTQYNRCMHHTHAHTKTHLCHTCAQKCTNQTHTCSHGYTWHTCVHTCILTYTKQYTHTHKIMHIAHTCTHRYGHKYALFLILSVSLKHCHLF